MKPIKAPDLSLLIKNHGNKWIAFSLNYKQLVAVAESLIALKQKLGQTKAIVMRVLPSDVGYAPIVSS